MAAAPASTDPAQTTAQTLDSGDGGGDGGGGGGGGGNADAEHEAEWQRLAALGLEVPDGDRLLASRCRHQHYADVESYRRMHFQDPMFLVSYAVGWPVLVADDDGEPVRQPFCSPCAEPRSATATAAAGELADISEKLEELAKKAADPKASAELSGKIDALQKLVGERQQAVYDELLGAKVRARYIGPVEQRASRVHALGVFAAAPLREGEFIGCYSGTVMTEEQWEEKFADSDYCVVVNDGAQGVVIDGEHGAANVLKAL
eukprot:SAG22_NODE_4764_length_1171_cov_1.275187_1_plen_260_part_10